MGINLKPLLAKATRLTRERAEQLVAEDIERYERNADYQPPRRDSIAMEGSEWMSQRSPRGKNSKRTRRLDLHQQARGQDEEDTTMRRSVQETNDDAALREARTDHFIHVAVVAAILVEPKGVDAFLDMDDAELGRAFKNHLWKAAGIASVHGIDLPSLRDEGYKLQGDARKHAKQSASSPEKSNTRAEKNALVRQGQLLCVEDYCKAAGITEQKLQKDSVARRIFSVMVGPEPYVPSLFLSGLFKRKGIAKIVELTSIVVYEQFDGGRFQAASFC